MSITQRASKVKTKKCVCILDIGGCRFNYDSKKKRHLYLYTKLIIRLDSIVEHLPAEDLILCTCVVWKILQNAGSIYSFFFFCKHNSIKDMHYIPGK